MKSPLRYPGGKSRALKYILPLIPEFKEYREPFLGGGSVFLNVKEKYPDRVYWINDLNIDLMSFWVNVQNYKELLIKHLYYYKNKFEDKKELYLLCKNGGEEEVGVASRIFILNRMTFSGTTESGGFSKQAAENRFTDSSIERIRNLGNVLDNVKLTYGDYGLLTNPEGENVFIYLDPPYFKATKLYGKNGDLHSSFDHERFAFTMKECTHKWLITYDDCEEVREAFKNFNIKEYNLQYGMNNKLGKELFIFNY